MAKEEPKDMTKEMVIKVTPKEGPVDLTKRVTQTTTDKHPYHKTGVEIRVSQAAADKNKLNGWAK